jgi:hypothetical protein
MNKYGPALVSCFRVHEDFNDLNVLTHKGITKGEYVGLHSMLIIGYRHDAENNKDYFLLQNWWTSKQFIEIDLAYLKACKPLIYFVETPQYDIPDKFVVNYSNYVENDLDKKEREWLEGPMKGLGWWLA